MIVELCATDLLKLVNGQQVAIDDVIVREAKGEISVVLDVPATPRRQAEVAARSAKGGTGSKRPASWSSKSKSNKTGAAIITARFDSICRACELANEAAPTARLIKGDEIYYDYDNKKAYCMTHGVIRFPHVKKEATTV